MRRWALSGLVVLVAVLASAVSGSVQRGIGHGNDFVVLYPLELLAVPLGAVAAARRLRAGREVAPGLLGLGLYLLIVAGAVSTAYPLWLPSDDAILGSALLAGVLAGAGASLALSSAAVLAGWPASSRVVVGRAGGLLAFLLVTLGGMVAPLPRLQVPLLVVAVFAMAALLLARRGRTPVTRPLAAAIAGGSATVAVLLARGPGDWASASTSVKLYSFPIALMALGIGLAMFDVTPRRDRQPASVTLPE
jgi:hypothetical protein